MVNIKKNFQLFNRFTIPNLPINLKKKFFPKSFKIIFKHNQHRNTNLFFKMQENSKLASYLTTAGKKETVYKNIAHVFLTTKQNKNLTFQKYYTLFKKNNLKLNNSQNPPLHVQNFFWKNLNPYKPLFVFFIQKVSKSVQKFSRGKSGKYFLT